MKRPGRAFIAGLVSILPWIGMLPITDAQQPIRVGASVSQTGALYGLIGQNQLRGYQLCLKHTNEKGGVLGRRIELVVEDDQSQVPAAVRNYEKLITQDKVDAILGPTSSPITDAVAVVAEKHRMAMVAPIGGVTSTFKKGRKFVFMLYSPSEMYLDGLVDMAAKRGLKTVALIYEDTPFPKAVTEGGIALAKRRGLSVVLVEAYPRGATDLSAVLTKVRAADPDVLAAATHVEDAVAVTRQLKELDVNPRMFAVTVGSDLPATSGSLYKKLITQDKVDLIIGPYSSPITEAVAGVAEEYRMPMVASGASASSIFKKGRKYVFMVFSPGQVYLEGD